jgi:hypothetical protein
MSDTLSVPDVLRSFADPSGLLPGEDRRDFEVIRQMMIDDIRPETNLEWLWIFDLVELSWEILRYRCLKQKILQASRVIAIQSILQRLDGAEMPEPGLQNMRLQTMRNAAQWSDQPDAAREIEARLERHGLDVVAINAEVFLKTRDAFALFDGLLHSAQSRRIILLREINARRDFAERAQKVSDNRTEARFAKSLSRSRPPQRGQ